MPLDCSSGGRQLHVVCLSHGPHLVRGNGDMCTPWSCSPLPLTGRNDDVVTDLTTSGNTFQTLWCRRTWFAWEERNIRVEGQAGVNSTSFPFEALHRSPSYVLLVSFWVELFFNMDLIRKNLVDMTILCLPILKEKEAHFISVPWKAETPGGKCSANVPANLMQSLQDTSEQPGQV